MRGQCRNIYVDSISLVQICWIFHMFEFSILAKFLLLFHLFYDTVEPQQVCSVEAISSSAFEPTFQMSPSKNVLIVGQFSESRILSGHVFTNGQEPIAASVSSFCRLLSTVDGQQRGLSGHRPSWTHLLTMCKYFCLTFRLKTGLRCKA